MCQRCNHLIVAAHRSAVQFQRHVRVHAACARRQLHLSRSLCCSCLLLRLRPQFPRVCSTVHGRGARTRFPAFSLRSPLVSRIHRLPTCAPSSALRTCSHFPLHFPPHPARGSHLQISKSSRKTGAPNSIAHTRNASFKSPPFLPSPLSLPVNSSRPPKSGSTSVFLALPRRESDCARPHPCA